MKGLPTFHTISYKKISQLAIWRCGTKNWAAEMNLWKKNLAISSRLRVIINPLMCYCIVLKTARNRQKSSLKRSPFFPPLGLFSPWAGTHYGFHHTNQQVIHVHLLLSDLMSSWYQKYCSRWIFSVDPFKVWSNQNCSNLTTGTYLYNILFTFKVRKWTQFWWESYVYFIVVPSVPRDQRN